MADESAPLKLSDDRQSSDEAVCRSCGETKFSSREDLVWEEARGSMFLVLGGLHGLKCDVCGETWFDDRSHHLIENYRRRFPTANYEVKVAKVGGNTLGMYFPKDLTRVLDLQPGLHATATPISDSAFIVELARGTKTTSRNTMRTGRGVLRTFDEALGF